jgi:hypothetical protein
MRLSRSAIQLYPRRASFSPPSGVRAAVSFHSHSECSRETLDFVPMFARRIPLVAKLYERSILEYEREFGRPLDFSSVYWRPPIAPAQVVASEREQLEQRFGLKAFVSLTDHDTLEGPIGLRAQGEDVPLSFEWSVPYGGTVLHLGVHNISPSGIDETERELIAFTNGQSKTPLGDLLDALTEPPETIIVLNHPNWDLSGVGQLRHDSAVLAFLRSHRDRVHALELNGYRAWAENRRVLPLAEGFGLPVIGGGDRHGYAPNTIINLTRATSLAEFADELRVDAVSHCVVFPEYEAPFVTRCLDTALDMLRPDRLHVRPDWTHRVFFTTPDGREKAVGAEWDRAPLWLSVAVGITRVFGSAAMRPVFELTRTDGHRSLATDCRNEPVFGRPSTFATPDSAAA